MLCGNCIPPSTTDACGRDSREQVFSDPGSPVVAEPRPMPTPSSTASAVNHVPGLPHQRTVLTPFLLNGDACTGSSCDNTVRSCKTIQIHFMKYVQRH